MPDRDLGVLGRDRGKTAGMTCVAVSRRQLLRGDCACRGGVHAKVCRFEIAAQLLESGSSGPCSHSADMALFL